MRIETKKFWFKKIQIFLEDNLSDVKELVKKYDHIIIISHEKLDLEGFYLREKNTAIIDLKQTEDEILKKFSDTTRNEIRRTYNNPDLNFTYNQLDFDLTYDLYSRFEKSQGRKEVGKNEMKLFARATATYKGDMLYGLYVVESFPYARIRSIFSKRLATDDKEMLKLISNSGRRLFWEVCQNLKNRRFVFLDLAAVNFTDKNKENLKNFKMSFGGDVIEEYTYIYKSMAYIAAEKIIHIKNKIF